MADVEGLDAWERLCRTADTWLTKAVIDVNRETAAKIIRNAKSRANRSRQARAAARGLSSSAFGDSGRVSLSGPFAMGAEFGAGQNTMRHRRSGTYVGYRQFPPWTGTKGGGLFLWPAVREASVTRAYGEVLDDFAAHMANDGVGT